MWPEPDRNAWAAAHHRGGLLDQDGQAAAWAVATSDLIARGYGSFLSFLVQTGGLNGMVAPDARITRPRIEAYVAYLRERNHSSTVDEVRLIPENGRLEIELLGDLAEILALNAGDKKPVTEDRDGLQVTVVAGPRNHLDLLLPTAFGPIARLTS